jgi:conjugative relaxase-like TrwC/TraI family protein
MLNVSKAMTAGAVQAYFQEGGHDYYIDADNPPGIWGGKLAREFGLTGEVQKEHFDRLAQGYHPITGEDLVLRRNENRRSANDITISAPKDFSLIYLAETDPVMRWKLEQAFVGSCDWIMDQMEPDAATRVRAGGADHDRRTGNWAYAGWLQFDSRPDDKTEMPVIQIHRHHTVFNLTNDKEADRTTALQIGLVKENADLWMPLFHNELARRVRELGYGIKREPETGIVGFGIEGIPRELVDKWSPRRATIKETKNRILEAMNDPDERAKLIEKYAIKDWDTFREGVASRLQDELARLTRKHKQKDLSRDELWNFWERQLSPQDRAILRSAKGKKGRIVSDAEAAQYAIGHLFYQKPVVAEKKLLAEGLRYGVGSVTLDGLKKELKRQGVHVINGQATTEAIRDQEAFLIRFTRDGRGKKRPVMAGPVDVGKLLERAKAGQADIHLTDEQAAAIRALVGSRDRLNIVDAGQGTGKTTMLEQYGAILARHHVPTVWLGTTHTAVDELKARGLPAMTLARFLASKEEQRKVAAGSRIILDEASMLNQGDASRLCGYAEEHGCRIDLVGDSKQYKAPVGGDTLGLLYRYAGVTPITMTKTMRQQGKLKEAMEVIRDGQVLKGHDMLKQLGFVHELPLNQLTQKAAELYLLWSAEGKQVPVISPTWAQADEITGKIRQGLKERGELADGDHSVRRLVNLHWSPAQMEDARKHGGGGATLLRNGAYSEESLKLAVGERVKTSMGGETKDGKHRLRAGQRYRVDGFTGEGDPILNNGWVIDKQWGGLVHDYVRTGQGWQGITADPRAIVVYGTPSLVATRQDGFYTPVSRVRKEVAVLTDSNAALRDAIQRQEKRPSATELFASRKRQKSPLRQRLGRHLAYLRRLAAFARTHERRPGDRQRTPPSKRELGYER